MLTGGTAAEERTRWLDLEPNPFDGRNGDSGAEDGETLAVFPPEGQVDEAKLHAAERGESKEESMTEKTTSAKDVDDGDTAGPRTAAAFQATVSEAQHEDESQLTAAMERVRQDEAERYAAELAGLREELERQYADDLQSARTAVLQSFKALTGSVLEKV